MTRKISTFIFIGLIFTVIVWMLDKSSVVTVDWRNYHEILSVPELMLLVLVLVLFIDICNRICRKIFRLQVKEAYKASYLENEIKESAAIDVLADKISEKIVIDRRDFDKSLLLVLRAMTAITAGDMDEARFHLKNLKKVIGNDPIIDVLKMKIYKGEKNYDKMEELSERIMKNSDIRIVGMKAAIEAQMEKKEFKEALETANRAFELRQDLYWIIESAFELRAKVRDWDGALQVLDAGRKKKIVPLDKYKRMKAIVLFEKARDFQKAGDEVKFFKFCSQAVESDDTLVPAALALAEYYKNTDNQVRKAADVLLKVWKKNPTDEVAYAYLNLYHKDDVKAKIKEMEELAMDNSRRPSLNNRILAELCAQAGRWTKAKDELEVFLINNPCTKKVCSLIAEYENIFSHDKKEAKSWKSKYKDCAEDSGWVCSACGEVTKEWHSICPKCKAFGADRWHLYVEKEKPVVMISDDGHDEEEE